MVTITQLDTENILYAIDVLNSSQRIAVLVQELYQNKDVYDVSDSRNFSPSNIDTIIPDSAGWNHVRQVKKLSSPMDVKTSSW